MSLTISQIEAALKTAKHARDKANADIQDANARYKAASDDAKHLEQLLTLARNFLTGQKLADEVPL